MTRTALHRMSRVTPDADSSCPTDLRLYLALDNFTSSASPGGGPPDAGSIAARQIASNHADRLGAIPVARRRTRLGLREAFECAPVSEELAQVSMAQRQRSSCKGFLVLLPQPPTLQHHPRIRDPRVKAVGL